MQTNDYTINGPARRPKGMMVVTCPSPDGLKTRAARLAERFANGRYSRQAGGYVMSQAAARKFEAHYAGGWDASHVSAKLLPPT